MRLPENEKDLRLFQLTFLVCTLAMNTWSSWRLWSYYPTLPYHALPLIAHLLGTEKISLAAWAFSYLIFAIATIGAALGFRPKIFLPVALLSGLIYFGTMLGIDIHQAMIGRPYRALNLLLPILALLALAPKRILELHLSQLLQPEAMKSRFDTLFLIKLTLALFYFANGVGKMRFGLTWLDGETVQSLLLDSWLRNGNGLAWFIANNDLICRLLSIGTVAFELAAPFLLFLPKGDAIFATAGISFHLGILALLGIDFISTPFFCTYLVFVRASWLGNFAKRLRLSAP